MRESSLRPEASSVEQAKRGRVEREVLDQIGRAMGSFSMLSAGDRIAVGVSGGKDSLCLAHALSAYRKRAPFPYEVVGLTLDQGKFTAPVTRLHEVFRKVGIRWVLREEPRTLGLVAEGTDHGCDVCSRNRRSALYRAAAELGCTVLALGHTADDCAESLIRNVLFNGRIASLPPVARARKGPIRVVRPLVYVTEAQTAEYVETFGLEAIGCVCSEKEGPRSEIRSFLAALEEKHPDIRGSVMSALANVVPYTLFDSRLQKHGADVPLFSRVSGSAE
jgi:tRNA 2-thiocytidine biosynthesis protein TtcA